MKALVLVSALLSAPVQAQQPTEKEFCVVLGDLAEQVMIARQADRPISELMNMNREETLKELVTHMVIAAYEQPSYSTSEYQQEAVQEFRNDWELQCYLAIAN